MTPLIMEPEMNSPVLSYLIRDLINNRAGNTEKEIGDMLLLHRFERIPKPYIFIGSGTCGQAAGGNHIEILIREYLELHQIDAEIKFVGCAGFCSAEPIMGVQLQGKNRLYYGNLEEESLTEILDGVFNRSVAHDKLIGQVSTHGLEPWAHTPFLHDLAFFKHQKRIILEHCGYISPSSIEEYIVHDGYRAFVKTILSYSPEKVCDLIDESSLRGRGGSGFPAARKWKTCYGVGADQKYLICNADESDPGAFTNRLIMESNPHLVIEGIALSAYASGASRAILFMKEDYTLARERMQFALNTAKEYGILGEDIFGSGFKLTITIRTAPGAYVLGEETALIACLEGKRANPQQKPPYPAISGFQQKPTVINNLETLLNVPFIMRHGPMWYNTIGTAESKGTKLLCLTGKTVHYGVVEVPFGITMNEVVYQIGGGIVDNKKIKAVHLGGPLGNSLPESLLNLSLDFESCQALGVGLGSGGVVVIGEDECLIDLVRYYMDNLQHESCGKCIPCREGNRRMSDILNSITYRHTNENTHETLERFKGVMQLESLAEVIHETSLCGLGKNAANPVMNMLHHFREELEEHIFERKCRANVCKELRVFYIHPEKCTGCTVCLKKCPANAIIGTPTFPHFIVDDKCTGCGICYDNCKFVAISIK